jgi:hypothetical protein
VALDPQPSRRHHRNDVAVFGDLVSAIEHDAEHFRVLDFKLKRLPAMLEVDQGFGAGDVDVHCSLPWRATARQL